jgi:hypothetical protein
MQLQPNDLNHVVRRLPKDIRALLTKYHGTLFLGGGFIRSIVAGEQVNDIDLFGVSKELLGKIAEELQATRGGKVNCLLHHTKNAITVICNGRATVQFITRWTFTDMGELISSFDFTVCQAAISRDGALKSSPWVSEVSDLFYIDLASKRLTYTSPNRDEEAGGSLLRSIKYMKRGYVMQIGSLAGVVARVAAAVDPDRVDVRDERAVKRVLHGLLEEVDPSIVVDGLEVTDDHETPNADFGLSEDEI